MPMPMPIPLPHHTKGPLDVPEIDGLAFAAKLLPENSSVHGFFLLRLRAAAGSALGRQRFSGRGDGQRIPCILKSPFEDQKP